ncbi:MAG TPA: hypothetical protein VFC79_01185 [Tissierellaceae bacterium]|nr:hypothetical protein [Tissierellaceae bacterium]
MKVNKKFRAVILMTLIWGLLSASVYAAYGSVVAISGGSSTTEFINDEFYNHIDYQGRSKEVYADSNRVKNIYAKVICSADGQVIGTREKTEHYTTYTVAGGSTLRKVDTTERAYIDTLARARYEDNTVSQDVDYGYLNLFHFFIVSVPELPTKSPAKMDSEIKSIEEKDGKYKIMLDNLHQRELNVLAKSKEFKMLNLNERSLEDGSIIFIDRLNLENHLDYRDKYIDYAIDHINEGDYIPSGVYVNRENNELYIVSISENRVYAYKLD